MRRVRAAAAVAAGVALLLAGCSSSTSKPSAVSSASVASTSSAAPTTSQPAAPAETCPTPLPDRGDIIEWQREPGLQDSAIELGGTDPEHCVWTFDTLKTSSPTGAGYCTEAAWASDNPNYNPDAVPAPRLKKVQVTIGDCG
jgi:hypothetical protein